MFVHPVHEDKDCYLENDPQELGDHYLTQNEMSSDQSRINGFKSKFLNQVRRFKRQTSSRSDTGDDRKNITVQTDSWPRKDDNETEVKETHDIKIDVPQKD